MRPEDRQALRQSLINHESVRLKPYLDCCGKPWRECVCPVKGFLSVGTGRNLDAKGISPDEEALMLDNDLAEATNEVLGALPWADTLNAPRLGVLIEMSFNLGLGSGHDSHGLRGFVHMLAALQAGDYAEAARQMLGGTWESQVHQRARDLAEQMRTGTWPPILT